jgi:hypothetical protein
MLNDKVLKKDFFLSFFFFWVTKGDYGMISGAGTGFVTGNERNNKDCFIYLFIHLW